MTSISSSAYATGSDQNNGNVMTGRSTTRRLAPPGGASSFSIGWGGGGDAVDIRSGKGKAQVTSSGLNSARLFHNQSSAYQPKKHLKNNHTNSFQIGYQKPNISGNRFESRLAGRGAAVINTNSSAGLRSKNPYYTQGNSGRMGMIMGTGRSDGLMLPTNTKVTSMSDKSIAYSEKNYGGAPTKYNSVSNYSPLDRHINILQQPHQQQKQQQQQQQQ